MVSLREAWSSKPVYLSLDLGHSMTQTHEHSCKGGIYVHSWHKPDGHHRILSCELTDQVINISIYETVFTQPNLGKDYKQQLLDQNWMVGVYFFLEPWRRAFVGQLVAQKPVEWEGEMGQT